VHRRLVPFERLHADCRSAFGQALGILDGLGLETVAVVNELGSVELGLASLKLSVSGRHFRFAAIVERGE
jgi:hypothetical protein